MDALRQTGRFIVDAFKHFEGATSQQIYVFPTNEPEISSFTLRDRLRRTSEARTVLETILSATQQTYVFAPNQPELSKYAATNQNRFLVNVERYFDGATAQPTFIFPTNQPEIQSFLRILNSRLSNIGPAALIVSSTQSFEFSVSQPEIQAFLRRLNANRSDARSSVPILGSTQSYEFPVNQPDLSQTARLLDRTLLDAPRYSEGATQHQTFVFPPNQPEIESFLVAMDRSVSQTGPTPQLIGTTQLFEFPVNQPELVAYLAQLERDQRIVAATRYFEGSQVQEIYIFYPEQPVNRQIAILGSERNRLQPIYIYCAHTDAVRAILSALVAVSPLIKYVLSQIPGGGYVLGVVPAAPTVRINVIEN